MKSKCPECNSQMKKISVGVDGARKKAISYQCKKCGYFEFEPESSAKVVKELKEKSPLRMKQKIIKLSKDRLGLYFSKDVVESLSLKSGETVYISVPDKNHVLLSIPG